MPNLRDKFRGCLVGAALGDIAGAPVEAESPQYIARTYRSIDNILRTPSIPEFAGPDWRVGHFTDDTQLSLCVAQWLLEDDSHDSQALLARFSEAYEPWRRYGPGVETILRLYPRHPSQWQQLATAAFPQGSHGNGSATRVAPVGLAFANEPEKLHDTAIASSRPTHSHPLAYQGAVLQATAVACAASSFDFDPAMFLARMRRALARFDDLLWDTIPYARALDAIEQGLNDETSCQEIALILGTGIDAREAVPMAIYCFLRHPHSYADVIQQAVFIGGDTDTIASMAGAISGAFLGRQAIPGNWLSFIRETTCTVDAIENLADRLLAKYTDGVAHQNPAQKEIL